jgi:hypothetical protein
MDRRLFVLLVFVLLAFGCTGSGGTSKSGDVRSGTKGLVLSLAPGSPPDKLFGNTDFTITVQVKNSGAASIDGSVYGGNIYVSGFDPHIVRFESVDGRGIGDNKPLDGLAGLGGKSDVNPQGDMIYKSFKAKATLPQSADSYKPTFLITACYSYETIAVAPVCIDPDPFSVTSKQRVCTTKDVGFSGGQGGPVAITKISLNPGTDKLRFTIDIANQGAGSVFDEKSGEGNGNSNKCSPYSDGLAFHEQDIIRVSRVEVASKDITASCQPSTSVDGSGKVIRLVDNKRSIYCELDIKGNFAGQPAFTSPITVKVRYGYRSSISKSVEILRIPGSSNGK